MSKIFINGMLAEKARLAGGLISEILSEMPDALMNHQGTLSAAASSLQDIHHELRMGDETRLPKYIQVPRGYRLVRVNDKGDG